MNPLKLSRLQVVAYIGATIPMLVLLVDALTGNLSVNPIQEATKRTGDTAFVIFILSLACTPIQTLFGIREIVKIRRGLGLFAFGYAFVHFLMYVWIDYRFDWEQIFASVIEKRYILVGSAALTILFALALTSFKWWMKRLGRLWKSLHRLVYLAGILIVLHVGWAVKGDFFTLQGDIWKPLTGGIIIALLLLVRIPFLRKKISQLRQGQSRRTQSNSNMPSVP